MTMVPPATTKDSYFEIAGLRTGASAKHSSQRLVERHHHLHCLKLTDKLSAFRSAGCWRLMGHAGHVEQGPSTIPISIGIIYLTPVRELSTIDS